MLCQYTERAFVERRLHPVDMKFAAELPKIATRQASGDVLEAHSGGGGGWGDPAGRMPKERARDALLGFVTEAGDEAAGVDTRV